MFQLNRLLVLIFFLLPFLFQCNGEEFDFCSNPVGTTELTKQDLGYFCFQENFNACFQIKLKVAEPAFQAIYFDPDAVTGAMVDLGEMDCLKRVDKKPATGYLYRVKINLHHGYVVKFSDGTFGRFFVDSLEGSATNITKVNLTWQYSF